MLDLAIRNGTIVDGSGLPRYRGDVGVAGGRIASVGRRLDGVDAARVIDATGRIVAPGFIDPHTHYDAQLCFDPYAFPAIEHGVTSVVTGNCSLSLAPVRPTHRERFSRMFRLIEEMPEAAFDKGVDWRWGESFGGMLDAVARDIAVNVGGLVGHSVLRMYVLGDDPRRAATDDEIAIMGDVLREALDAGALGLSTSYVDVEDDLRPVPCRFAEHRELEALCARARRARSDAADRPRVLRPRPDREPDRAARRPVAPLRHPDDAVAAVPQRGDPGRRRAGDGRRRAGVGRTVRGCGRRCRPGRSTSAGRWASAASCSSPSPAGGTCWRCPMRRRSSTPSPTRPCGRSSSTGWTRPWRCVAPAWTRPTTSCGKSPSSATATSWDARWARSPASEAPVPPSCSSTCRSRRSWGRGSSATASATPTRPPSARSSPTRSCTSGASDGGAHVGSFATYGDTGFLLSRYVRETGALTLEGAIKKLTADPATIWGLPERGELKPGYAADVVVFDADTVDRGPEIASDDFPGGGTRWIRRSVGVDSVIVNGVVTWTATDGYAPDARGGLVTVPQ